MLCALQAAITTKQVDGHRFNDLLKSNTLHDLRIDGLNPRIAVTIRRAWNKDFNGVRFIPHYAGPRFGGNAGGIDRSNTASPTSTPPPYAQRIQSAERRKEEAARSGLAGGEASVPAVAAASDFFSGSLDSQIAPKAAAPRSYAPPQPAVKAAPPRRRSPASDEGGASLGDLMAPKPPAPKTFAVPNAQNQEQRRPRRPPAATGWEGVSLGDAMVSGKQAQDRYATPQHETTSAPSGAGRPGRRHTPTTNGWEGISLDNALGPGQLPQGEVVAQPDAPAAHSPGSCSPPNLDSDGGASRAPHFRKHPPSRSDWDGISLGDALSSAKCEQSRFGAGEPPMPEVNGRPPVPGRRRTEVNNGWDGVGLGEALGPKQPVRRTYGQTEDTSEPRCVEHTHGRASPLRRDNGWNGISLGDAMQRHSEHKSGYNVVEVEPPFDASAPVAPGNMQTPQQPADPWAGVSLADAMGKPSAPTAAASNSNTGTSATAPIDWSKEPRKCRGRGGSATVQTSSCDKSPAEIMEWLKTLPESHVPEKTREEISAVVEQSSLSGDAFTAYVQSVPPEVCAPKHAMKLKNAWANVLREAEARAIAKQNFDAAAQGPQKGIEVKC